jgi:hypothetical protein
MLYTANFPSSLVIFTLIIEAIRSSETFVPRATRRNIPEDSLLEDYWKFKSIARLILGHRLRMRGWAIPRIRLAVLVCIRE